MKKTIILLILMVMMMSVFVGCGNNNTSKEINANETIDSTDNTNEPTAEETISMTTEEVISYIRNDAYVIVDTRLNDVYNGWSLEGKNLGGHIEGAVDFSYNWLNKEEALLKETLQAKGISPDKTVVLYDTNLEQIAAVKSFLSTQGFENILIYDLNNWSENLATLVSYENYELIVPAVVVKDILDGKVPETFESAKNIKVIEASWGEEKTSYANGHVPTAFHINTDAVEPPPTWMLGDDATLEQFALTNGFKSTDTVIVTGEEQMAAYRVAVVLRYIGVEDVRVLNGGTQAWTDAGYELETSSNKAEAVENFGAVIPGNADIIETIDELKVSLKSPEFTLVDNRTHEEFIGETSGYSYHDKAGRITGAKFGYAGFENAYSMSFFRNPDNTMRRPEEFLQLWEAEGIDINTRLAFMCGSGWRASEILYYADVYGIESITLYSDGWIGWSNAGNPFETGDQN